MHTLCQTEHQRLIAVFKEEQLNDVKAVNQPICQASQPSEFQSTPSSFILGNIREWEVKLAASQAHQIPILLEEKIRQALAPTMAGIKRKAEDQLLHMETPQNCELP